jgi:hypothetical protein
VAHEAERIRKRCNTRMVGWKVQRYTFVHQGSDHATNHKPSRRSGLLGCDYLLQNLSESGAATGSRPRA